MPRVVVLGVGNELRHDDAAGLEVVRRARALARPASSANPAPAIEYREHEGETLALLGMWEGAGAMILVDAIHGSGPVGAVQRFDLSRQPLPARLEGSSSTHAISVADAIELGRELGRLPRRVVVYGVTGARFDAGRGLSAALLDVVGPLARRVLEEAQRLAATAACP